VLLARSRRLRLLTLCALYLVQGIPTGFVTITLAALLASQGYSAGAVAQLLAISWVPWAIKIFYGPFLDHYTESRMGRRRPWLMLAQGGMLAALCVLFALPGLEVGLVVIGAVVVVHNLFSALQDVATDALAVDLLDPDERGFVSGAMWSSKIGGIVIGGAGMSTVLNRVGWRPAIAIPIVLLLIVIALSLLVRERVGEQRLAWPLFPATQHDATQRAAPDEALSTQLLGILRRLKRTFQQPAAATLALLALVAPVPTRMMVTFGPVFTVQQLGWSDAGYSQFAGGPALVAGAAGALLGGWLADRYGRKLVIKIAVGGIMLAFVSFAASASWWTTTAVIVAFFLTGVFLDMTLKMALQAIYMTLTRSEVTASQFTIYMTLGNMGNVIGSGVVVPLDAFFDAQMIFVSAAVLGLVPLVLLRWLPQEVASGEVSLSISADAA
jgi:PAT family beta-lactamase induction signal transducer AmpG